MHALVPVAALLLATAVLLTGSGLQGILLPVRAGLEGFSSFRIALISSCYFTGFAVGCVFGPRMVRHVGHIRTFTAMTAIAAAVALVHGLLVVAPCWWLLRMLSGFCFAVLYMVIESWLNERSTPESRGAVLSTYMVINLTVVTLGQLLLPLQDPRGLELFAITSLLITLAAVPVSLSGATAPPPIERARLDLGKLYAVSPAGVVACFAIGLANGPFWALSPEFARSQGLDASGISWFMSAAVLGGAMGQWPLGRLSDRGDRRNVILLAAALAAGAGILLTTRPFDSNASLFALAAAWGAFTFPIYTLGVAHTNDHAAAEDFVETAGGLLLVFATGAVLGPLLASAVTGVFGPGNLFAFSAGIHALLIVFVVWRRNRQATPPIDEHIPFASALAAATTVSPVFDAQVQEELESTRGETQASD